MQQSRTSGWQDTDFTSATGISRPRRGQHPRPAGWQDTDVTSTTGDAAVADRLQNRAVRSALLGGYKASAPVDAFF